MTCDVPERDIVVLLGWCFHGVQKVYNCLMDNESRRCITSGELLIGFPLLYSGALKGAMESLDIMGSKPLNSHTASRSCIWSICIFHCISLILTLYYFFVSLFIKFPDVDTAVLTCINRPILNINLISLFFTKVNFIDKIDIS